jgi:hypothetical protein
MMSFILFLAAMQSAGTLPPQAAVQRAVERLDMSTFPNSLGSVAREGRKRTLRQLGDQRFAWDEGALEVTESDGGWVRIFKPLRSPRGRMRLCFVDQALNGGTYLTSSAIELTALRSGGYRARPIKHRDCESYAR